MAKKLTIVYWSMTGHNLSFARIAADEAEKLGAEVRLVRVADVVEMEASNPAMEQYYKDREEVPVATVDDLVDADAILFSSPTRYGNICASMMAFFETLGGAFSEGAFLGKRMSAMATAGNAMGGQEWTIRSLYTVAAHFGMVIVPPGFTPGAAAGGGMPYGTAGHSLHDGFGNEIDAAIRDQVRNLLANVAE